MNFLNIQNIINPKLKEFIDEKMNTFIDFIKEVTPKHKKEELNSEYDYLKRLCKNINVYIILKKDNCDENIQEFMNKYDIDNEHFDKIKEYYQCFLDLKEMFLGNDKKE